MPIDLTPVSVPTQANAEISQEDVLSFQELVAKANFVNFPAGKTVADLTQFSLTVRHDGGGFLSVTIK